MKRLPLDLVGATGNSVVIGRFSEWTEGEWNAVLSQPRASGRMA
jgi:hypothetical protein